MARAAYLAVGLLLALAGSGMTLGADEVDKQRQRLAKANDPGERAKISVKLGDELLKRITAAYRHEDREGGEELLSEYRETILAAGQALLASGRVARRQPRGFKELEIHLRKGERALLDVGRGLVYDQKQIIDETREEMEKLRQALLAALMRSPKAPRSNGS